MTQKNVYFTDGRPCWVCEVVGETCNGIYLRMYGKETFFPWHQIDRIEKR